MMEEVVVLPLAGTNQELASDPGGAFWELVVGYVELTPTATPRYFELDQGYFMSLPGPADPATVPASSQPFVPVQQFPLATSTATQSMTCSCTCDAVSEPASIIMAVSAMLIVGVGWRFWGRAKKPSFSG